MISRGSRKIHPSQILKSDEFQAGVEEAEKRRTPYRARSVDYSALTGSPGGRTRQGSVSSFLSQTSNPPASSVETLINYLTTYMEVILVDKEYLRKFEELSGEVISYAHDMELLRIVKAHGWTGSRYRGTEETPFEAHSLLQALSNLYLKNKVSNYTQHISNMFGLGDEKGADQILSFCPDLLLTCLRESPLNGDHEGVKSFPFRGACMLADISGFSKFSGAMCQKGVSGLDDLREATNGFLGQLVKTVYEYHGDVIAFAGDALICVFLDQHEQDQHDLSGCYRAIQCACILRGIRTNKLSAHIGVSYGEMKIAFLGGLHDQWVYLLNGACVTELAGCIEDAGPQQLVVTQECYEQAMKHAISLAPVMSQSASGKHSTASTSNMGSVSGTDSPRIRLKAMSSPGEVTTIHEDEDLPPIVTKLVEGSNRLLIDRIEERTVSRSMRGTRKMSLMMKKQTSRVISMESHQHSQSIIEAAALFVPRPVLAAVYSESLEHIGELRQVTTMFLSLDSYSPVDHRDPASLQPFFIMAQQALFEAGGFLRQFLVDDKGCVFIAMWGMPSFTYANNCSRALYCAASIRVKTLLLEHRCSIGITTGNVFCGNVGAPERRDYAGIGNEVNLAARLMGKAKGRILIDTPTHNNLSAATQSMLSSAEEMQLKGMEKPVIPFQYTSDVIPQITAVDENQGYSTILRRQVKAVLGQQMDRISNADTVSSIGEKNVFFTVILGMPGTGKSTAAEYFRHGMRKRNIQCLLILARPGHEGVPYGVMRELFLELVGEDNFQEEGQQREKINYLVEQAFSDAEEEEKAKARNIVEMVLGVDWSDSFRNNHSASDDMNDRQGSDSPHRSPNSSARISTVKSPNASIHKGIVSPRDRDLRKSVLTGTTKESKDEMETGSNSSQRADMLMDEIGSAAAFARPEGDLTFYKILCVLLKGEKVAIIIEDAHFCDELSWNELHLLLIGVELNAVVLLTMRSSTSTKAPPSSESTMSEHHRGGRKSVLISQKDIASLNSRDPQEMDNTSRYGLKLQTSAAYLSILGHENSTVVEMNSLNEAEVKDIVLHTLQVQDISIDLVKLVLDVSSGNAFWCKAIASFIKERGAQAFEKAAEHESRVNSLKQLILLRMEKLDVDHQLVLKHASIIGDEFSEKMLQKVLPEKLWPKLAETMELLAEHGFILCIAESPQFIFGFQNDLIRQTVYELTPPRDAAHVHLAVAEFIEEEYAKNLRPFYPLLSAHYQKSHGKRALSFKYAVKAADQAISRGAFGDGLRFAQIASPLAVSKPELRVLLLVISRALHDIGPTVSLAQVQATRRYSQSAPSPAKPKPVPGANSRVSAYMQLKVNIENSLERISKGASIKPEEAMTGNKNRLVINKQPSARLNWQPSYVASKLQNDSDSEDEDEVSSRSVKQKPTNASSWFSQALPQRHLAQVFNPQEADGDDR